ncbi:hypothetical protein Hokovirus_1_54 [Hokovirus HKV1]|uniref:Uncharacterized protein n=1 Tax=Hokovirus HKV1 TaxID=1977638 RepID=A0A1V0SEM6_9VIRU|nr:hypothetical protein Hokovirus_1_54 [Hokovirus HKV1]
MIKLQNYKETLETKIILNLLTKNILDNNLEIICQYIYNEYDNNGEIIFTNILKKHELQKYNLMYLNYYKKDKKININSVIKLFEIYENDIYQDYIKFIKNYMFNYDNNRICEIILKNYEYNNNFEQLLDLYIQELNNILVSFSNIIKLIDDEQLNNILKNKYIVCDNIFNTIKQQNFKNNIIKKFENKKNKTG